MKWKVDFWKLKGIELLFRDGLENYGWIIIVANWVPGIVASMHILHMYRTKLPAKKTILFTGRIFYCILMLIKKKFLEKHDQFVFIITFNYYFKCWHLFYGRYYLFWHIYCYFGEDQTIWVQKAQWGGYQLFQWLLISFSLTKWDTQTVCNLFIKNI